MARKLIVNGNVFDYPTAGTYNWGEDSSAWAEEITTVLNTLSGPEDIQTTEATLLNGQQGNVPGLSFNAGLVQRVSISAVVTRTFSDATPARTEEFNMQGAYNGAEFAISIDTTPVGGDSSVKFDITNAGQVIYDAEDVPNTLNINIKFRATAITQSI